MSAKSTAMESLGPRLEALSVEGQRLESEGLPFPTAQIRSAVEQSLRSRKPEQAFQVLKRGEALLARVLPDWSWVRELLRRADELRSVAQTLGVDVAHLDSRVGNPRRRLMSEPLSEGSLEKAAASASLALAVLNDAIPKFCVQEAQQLGVRIRRARDRGEEVRDAAASFSRLIQAVQDQNISTAAQRLVELRREVGRIPRAPALPSVSPNEEEEILVEARNLARRLQRIKGKAANAQSAARLMAQVRAAISEDRRYGTPEEEIEALWAEVDRLTRERRLSEEGPPLATEAGSEERAEPLEALGDGQASGTEPLESEEEVREREASKSEEEPVQQPPYASSLYVPYLPPAYQVENENDESDDSASSRARRKPRPRP